MFYLSIGIILFVFFASLFFKRRFLGQKFAKLSFYFSLLIVFIFFSVLSVMQFFKWEQGDFSKYFIPPYQDMNYLIFYCFSRFFGAYVVSAIGAFVFLILAEFINKKCGERFFYPEEPYLGALSVFIAGFPGFLFYAVFLIAVYLLRHVYSLLPFGVPSGRISLRRLWLPAAIFVIIINNCVIQNLPIWGILKI
jgi:hypothetical protein